MTDLQKKFNIGLNLDASIEDLDEFFSLYSTDICSVYFSLPLGASHYTRRSLETEYAINQHKLPEAIGLLKKHQIKTEITFNTKLSDKEFETALKYLDDTGLIPDEFVCLNSYAAQLKKVFPHAEIISSFCNGTSNVSPSFDTVVLAQRFLREKNERDIFLKKGYNIILLLNNGCSYFCNPVHCDSKSCPQIYRASLQSRSYNQIYALQSFFPEELYALLDTDCNSASFRFKLANRSLGLDCTKKMLFAYKSIHYCSKELFEKEPEQYMYFGALHQLCRHIPEYSFGEIVDEKIKLNPHLVEYFK